MVVAPVEAGVTILNTTATTEGCRNIHFKLFTFLAKFMFFIQLLRNANDNKWQDDLAMYFIICRAVEGATHCTMDIKLFLQ